MATKDNILLFKNKHKSFNYCHTDIGAQYSDLNLNQNPKDSNIFPIQSHSKSYNNKKIDYTLSETYEGKEKSQTWKKSSTTNFCSKYSNSLSLNDENEKCWKTNDSSNATNNSTLSLRISAYEDPNEAPSLNKSFQKLWLIQRQKQINPALTFVSQNPFEFQRQQNDKVPEPEVSQFIAPQRLINNASIKMLQTLSFSNEANKRWDTVEDGKSVAAKILETKRIHTLDLSGNTLGVQAAEPIAEALKKHPELKIAQWNNLFTTRLNTEIPVVLKSFTDAMIFAGTRLTTLDLSDNAIGPQAIHGLQDFLSSEACFGLKNLYLNNCGLGSAGITVAKCLIDCHHKAMRSGKFFELEVFVAGRNRLENPGAKALAEAFSTLKSLVEVRMYQNGIKDAGIKELAKAFAQNPKLKIIDLNDNTFNEPAATVMSKVVGRLNNLVYVNFSDCLCRAKGCINIAYELVNANSSVQELLLGGNEIDADTMQKISQLSIQLPSLKKLALGSNNLGSKFDTIKRHFKNEIIDFGEESDDQGTLSASEEENIEESESDGGEEENGASGEDDWDNDEEFLASFVDKDILAALDMLTVEEGQTLSFSNEASKRWDTVEDGKRVAAKILETKRIHTLDLSGNTLGVQAAGPIAEALKKHPELKIAQWNNLFTTRLNTEIPVVLKSFTDAMIFAGTRLTTLDLSDNAIGPQAIHGLQDFLSSEACFGLKNLYLNNCGLGSAGITVAKCLITCHQKAVTSGKRFELEVFVAGRNRLENPGAKALAEAFSTLKSLVEVRMYQNGIKDAGIKELAKAFAQNPKLKIIDLNDNTFNEPAATVMSKVVGRLNNLVYVNFSDCLCRAQGCLNIVQELVDAKSPIQELLLAGNEIDADTMQKISQLSIQLPSLKKLALGCNNLGSKYDTIKRRFKNEIIDFGEESDDQGSLSESEG